MNESRTLGYDLPGKVKQGIEDGYLTPYRVKSCTNQIIDEYVYDEDDKIIQGEELLEKDKPYMTANSLQSKSLLMFL